MKGYAKAYGLKKSGYKQMKYQVKKVNGNGINEYLNRIKELYGLIGKCSEKIVNAQDLEKQMLEPCNGIKEKLAVIRNKEYKSLDKRIKRNRKMKDLYTLEKQAIENELQNYIALLVLNAIALNIEYIGNIQVHYKRALNVINDSLSDAGIKIYISSYDRIEAYMKGIGTSVSYGCSGMTYNDVYKKEDLYEREEILSLTEIKREIEELMPEINTITLLHAYREEYINKVNSALEKFNSYEIKEYIKEESKYNDIR